MSIFNRQNCSYFVNELSCRLIFILFPSDIFDVIHFETIFVPIYSTMNVGYPRTRNLIRIVLGSRSGCCSWWVRWWSIPRWRWRRFDLQDQIQQRSQQQQNPELLILCKRHFRFCLRRLMSSSYLCTSNKTPELKYWKISNNILNISYLNIFYVMNMKANWTLTDFHL